MSSDLFVHERREQIVSLVRECGRVSVAGLGEQFGVSQTTIRTDLDVLAQRGLLVRTRGGAVVPDRGDLELDFHIRRSLNMQEKQRIGAAAAALIEDDDSILLDASTTALAIVDHIKDRRRLNVITNGVLTAMALLDAPGITVLMPGGFLYRDSASLVGRGNKEYVSQFILQKGFFGAVGFTLEEGLTDVNNAEVAIKRDLIACTKRVIAVIDSSKWGKVGFASYASVERIDDVITDDGAPADMVAALRGAGVKVTIV